MEEPAPYFCIAIGSWCEITESGKWHGRWCEVLSLAMAGRREGYVVAVPGAATDVWVDQRYLRVIVWPGNPDTAPPRAPHVEERRGSRAPCVRQLARTLPVVLASLAPPPQNATFALRVATLSTSAELCARGGR